MTYVPCRYEEIKQLCVDRWNAYHSPLHAAAYILDPQFQHGLQWKDKEVMNGWNTILERLVPDTRDPEASQHLQEWEDRALSHLGCTSGSV